MQASVVICTFNRCESLKRALASLKAMVVPQGFEWELIVVDNRSTDSTKAVVEEFARTAGFPVTYLWEGAPGSSEARNAGIRRSRGEIISFLDDDVQVFPDWLMETFKAFSTLGAACIGGKALLPPHLKFPKWWDHTYEGTIGRCDLGEEVQFNRSANLNIIGANVSFRRFAFEKYGLLDAKLSRRGKNLIMGEESEFIRRLRALGEFAAYNPKSIVYHVPDAQRMTISYLSRWYFRRGQWEWFATQDTAFRPGMVVWLGAPRWIYGAILRRFLRICLDAARFRWREAVYSYLQVSFHVGRLTYFFKARENVLLARRTSHS